jgi:hypothetical protein
LEYTYICSSAVMDVSKRSDEWVTMGPVVRHNSAGVLRLKDWQKKASDPQEDESPAGQ